MRARTDARVPSTPLFAATSPSVLTGMSTYSGHLRRPCSTPSLPRESSSVNCASTSCLGAHRLASEGRCRQARHHLRQPGLAQCAISEINCQGTVVQTSPPIDQQLHPKLLGCCTSAGVTFLGLDENAGRISIKGSESRLHDAPGSRTLFER
jgi:hypothetical protein